MHQDLLSIESFTGGQRASAPTYAEDWCITASGRRIGYQQYRRDVLNLAARIPEDARFALNLCKDRYHFLVAFHAVALKGQTSLLPPNEALGTQRELFQQYDNCYIVCDESQATDLDALILQVKLPGGDSGIDALAPGIDVEANHLAAILFTSGTSGKPFAVRKRWGDLQAVVQLTAAVFGLDRSGGRHLVATVPPQHMFGLEVTIMLPLTCGTKFISSRPFFPEDIRQALNSAPGRTILVTTPMHLKFCVDSDLDWRSCGCDLILCSTAPLSEGLAASAEKQFGAPVKEIYGSTETGALASRRTVEGDEWRLYPEISAQPHADGYFVTGGHLSIPCRMSDRLLIRGNGYFKLLGRHSDMIKLAGKRASLSELNAKLNQISGVADGAFIDTTEPGQETRRLAAAVVAPGMRRRELLNALAEWLDPVFLPRPLLFVDTLPRNQTGKLSQQALRALLES
jgi:acyl-coenzyme A synthetase/AMP-(fatty) acid ligase